MGGAIGSKYNHKRVIIGPPAGVPLMDQHLMLAWQLCDFQGILTSIAEKSYIFVIFLGGSGSLVPTLSRSAHVSQCQMVFLWTELTIIINFTYIIVALAHKSMNQFMRVWYLMQLHKCIYYTRILEIKPTSMLKLCV